MSDFNKGDFTQQGVDGHVRATLRLNEKRYVELDLTTNENARGCTISGNVHDRLNNLDYPIGAAPSGNIAITENTTEGEPLDVSQYATATVNVAGGGDSPVPMCEITVTNTSQTDFRVANQNRTIVIHDNIVVDNEVFSGESVVVYSPYVSMGGFNLVAYFTNITKPTEQEALRLITNPVNVLAVAQPFDPTAPDSSWIVAVSVIDITKPSSFTIPCERK